MSENGKPKCLIPGCTMQGKRPGARGMCYRHYHGAMIRVKSGKTTWEELEALGLAAKPIPRPESFDVVLQAAREKKGQQP